MRKNIAKKRVDGFLAPGRYQKESSWRQRPDAFQRSNMGAALKSAPMRTNYRDQGLGFNLVSNFLGSRVGKRWDQVYAEFCAGNDPRNYNQQLLRSQLRDKVEERVVMVDGKPTDPLTGRPLTNWRNYQSYYVDPDTGLLQPLPQWQQPRRRRRQTAYLHFPAGDQLHKYVQVDNIWYLVTFKQLSDLPANQALPRDIVFKTRPGLSFKLVSGRFQTSGFEPMREWGARILAVHKRQLNKKEIRDYIQPALAELEDEEQNS